MATLSVAVIVVRCSPRDDERDVWTTGGKPFRESSLEGSFARGVLVYLATVLVYLATVLVYLMTAVLVYS